MKISKNLDYEYALNIDYPLLHQMIINYQEQSEALDNIVHQELIKSIYVKSPIIYDYPKNCKLKIIQQDEKYYIGQLKFNLTLENATSLLRIKIIGAEYKTDFYRDMHKYENFIIDVVGFCMIPKL